MAKVSLTKLNKIKSMPIKTIELEDNIIEVKQYLPLSDKMNLIISVIDQSGNGEEGFFNIVKLDAYYRIEMISAYTNISFTEKQLEDPTKLYDILELNSIWSTVNAYIPESEKNYIWLNILELAKQITTYNSSAMGILKTMTANKDQLDFDITEIMSKINDPQALATLKEILGLTGVIE